ncbi:MFS transporter [Actinorhabdospora filicis]|uniref:MFS transporter n=1 Tax=Actinorhabdospora filicis TaxID=1785913 RepID=A0A9W6SQ47_9ACTN|nr:MFS transporter [Actinorhabdospora filicis]GLZ79959.1 MFS transporter [Actinorhabdospora filicis]
MTTHVSAPPAPTVPARRWLALIAVAVGTFTMVTVEQLPMGLLTGIGGSLNVTTGAAGLMVTVPGIVACLAAPLLPVAIGRVDRRIVLIALLALMVGANVLTSVAPNFTVMLVSRFLVGIGIGGFWALAAGLAVRMVPPAFVGQASAITFGGATAANVLGVPVGTMIGEFTSWRTAFAVLGGLAVLVIVALVTLLPALPADEPVRLSALAGQFRKPSMRVGVSITFFLITAHYATFTFVSPLLTEVAGISQDLVGPLLLAFGVAGLIGNFTAGRLVGRDVRKFIIAVGVLLAAVLALFPMIGATPVTGIALLIAWGLVFGSVPVSVQTWIFKAAGDQTEAATALNSSVFNLAIALGAAVGGVMVNAVSIDGALWVGGAVAVLTSLVVWRSSAPR